MATGDEALEPDQKSVLSKKSKTIVPEDAISNAPSKVSRVSLKSKYSNVSKRTLSNVGANILSPKVAGPLSVTSSIRTTTTTRERLENIEKQLELEVKKR